jgi:hypothetical protein
MWGQRLPCSVRSSVAMLLLSCELAASKLMTLSTITAPLGRWRTRLTSPLLPRPTTSSSSRSASA